jgi:DNA repair protein RecO (recombination protein O)
MSAGTGVDLQPGWILHRRPFRDSSEIHEAFTRDFGRVGLISRGSRRRRRRPPLEPFVPLLLSWRGRGELFTLSSAEARGAPVRAPGERLMSLFYVNELVLRLVSRLDPHPGLFDVYERLLAAIGAGAPEAPTLRVFERDLLAELGLGLCLEVTGETGEPIDPSGRYEYVLEHGPRPVGADRQGQLILSGATLKALAAGRLETPAAEAEARRLTRAALALYLGDRPLRTREVLRSMRSRARR